MSELKRTILCDAHIAAGATMVDFGGWEMPIQYPEGIINEHLYCRKECGIFDVSHMGRIDIEGPDAVKYLQHILSSNVLALDLNQAQYALLPDENGNVIDDVYLYRFEMDKYLLVINAGNIDKDMVHLNKVAEKFDVKLTNVSDIYASIAVQGPKSKDILKVMTGGAEVTPENVKNALHTCLMDGKPVDYKKIGIGYLPEERGLYPKKVIIEQLTYFAELKGMSRKDAVKAIDYWLNRLGMTEYRNKRLDTLSKGNQQKIQLVTALAHDPDIVILDEPFSGLDPVNAMLLKDVVKEQIGKGKIVLFSSHQMSYIEEFCDSIAIINAGKVVLHGDLHDIKRNYPRDRLVVRTESPDQILADFGASCKTMETGDLLIQLSSPEEKKSVMTRLVEHYDIDEVKVYEPSLNDIFVEYAGDAAGEG